jgi:hypothetical protein
MIRVGMIFFASDGTVYMVASVDAVDAAGAVRSQWTDGCASCIAYWGPASGQSASYSGKP